MLEQFRKQLASFIAPVRNAMSLPQQFLRYGGERMLADWTQVVMTDQDFYTGYGYSAIKKRANAVARIAIDDVKTESKKEGLEHPYLEILNQSKTFTNYRFWYEISTYLDLEGVYYLMAIRAAEGNRIGNIKEFKLLNPYNIRRIKKADAPDVVEAYVEARGGFVREIPKDMIIEISELNPFDYDKPFALTDAAKEPQFTLKTASDYTRHSLKGNINAPGIVSTDIALEEEDFKNFMSRVRAHKKGEPIFGNGSGAITWKSMQTELAKAGLNDINEISRDSLFSAMGVSKTMMGIEQSGTTRETAKVQKDLMIESEILPRIQLIIDALNQDYKNNYPDTFKQTEATLIVDNPLAVDHDSDLKDTDVKTKQFDLYTSLVNKGYKPELAASYVNGDIDVAGLGKPTNPPVNPILPANTQGLKKKSINQTDNTSSLVESQAASLQNAVINIEAQAAAIAVNKLAKRNVKNDISDYGDLLVDENELITKSERKNLVDEMIVVLTAFYGIVINLQGGSIMRDRVGEFALTGSFALDKDVRKWIKETAKKVSISHIDTVSNELFETARKAALAGKSQQQIISELTTKFQTISDQRAKVVARTETNRAFTRAQFDADRQFIDQNELNKRAYKRWRTRSANPCPFCQSLEAEGLIPFGKAFRALGEKIEADGKTLDVGFESLEAGNAHPNCSCVYELVILDE